MAQHSQREDAEMAKLVEILARELKEWHNSWPALGQSSDGSLHREPFLGGHTNFCLTLASDYSDAIVTRAEWQAAVDALKAKELVEWDGVGLPPVGGVVEVERLGDKFKPKSIEDWRDGDRVECIAHYAMQGEHVSPVFFNRRTFQFSSLRDDCFRPIRTPEQIAAEEREKFIDELIKVTCIRRGEAGLIYDAGYRKQEPK